MDIWSSLTTVQLLQEKKDTAWIYRMIFIPDDK
jgi:hypothetical protein